MKNAIKYYYNLDAENIHQNKKNYKFTVQEITYLLNNCTRTYREINEIYNLQIYLKTIGFYTHEIILNNKKNIITNINGIPYILLKIQITNRKININDIIAISNVPINIINYSNIKRDNWYNLWTKKIDFIEYQISQFKKKYPLIRESSDYYIGIIENCITLLSELNNNNEIIAISHNRIEKNTSTEEFYNPLNYILDIRIRDIGEYLKTNIMENKYITKCIEKYIRNQKLTIDEIKKLFIRILYPSKYLDICEQILNNKKEEKELLKIINSSEIFENNIKNLYNFFNTIIKMPEIEWLNK